MHQKFTIKGMTCESCVAHVSMTLSRFGGVEVTRQPPQAVFADNAKATLLEVNEALAGSKYSAALPGVETETGGLMQNYYPLLLIASFLLLVTVATSESVMEAMRHFMAAFFIVFSFFKLLDLSGFAASYASYDLLARRARIYGLAYPFIELALGLAYLVNFNPVLTNWATLVLMGFGTLGVLNSRMKKQQIRCACLGTVFNLPMSNVTLIEDLAMVAMAAIMLAG